jgi:hypothetical protein
LDSYPDTKGPGLSKIIPDIITYKNSILCAQKNVMSLPVLLCHRTVSISKYTSLPFIELQVRERHIHNIPFQADFIKGEAQCETQEFVT